ncbi:hypothetical protein BU17DRAFT_98961 [Hysterangium stoloniferum]|nr:hypothetical protein BU17DRAFT_98961 [Hysterangium stoloniferum]
MTSSWLAIAQSISSTASVLTHFSFGAAKAFTKFGFAIARNIINVAPIPLLSTSLDHLENISLLPILLGESIASTSLNAASSVIFRLLESGATDSEASFSLASFVTIARNELAELGGLSVLEISRAVAAWAAIQGFTKEWSEARWLKHTTELTSDDFKPPVRAPSGRFGRRERAISRVSVTEDSISPIPPGRLSQVVSADIGEKTAISDDVPSSIPRLATTQSFPARSNYETWNNVTRLSKLVLAGYGGVGLLFFGAPLHPDEIVSASSKQDIKQSEEDILVHAVEDAETEALSSSQPHISFPTQNIPSAPPTCASAYSWWNVLLGKHDRDIFEGFAFRVSKDLDGEHMRYGTNSQSIPSSPISTMSMHFPSSPTQEKSPFESQGIPSTQQKPSKRSQSKPSTTFIGDMRHMPRFWVLTDHVRRQVVLVVRGTMSFNELAADLTCEPTSFVPATSSSAAASQPTDDLCEPPQTETENIPTNSTKNDSGSALNNEVKPTSSTAGANGPPSIVRYRPSVFFEKEEDGPPYKVHSGILQLARAMGSKGRPVHDVISAALSNNSHYELVLCGHSLGAGVATLLALMWADPTTCRTVPSSGLSPNRRVSVYCFAPPCVTSPSLSRLCRNLITSLVYSFDCVSRLSLGSMRDLNKAVFWLCEGKGEASTVRLLRRALQGKIGFGELVGNNEDEKKWFIAVRKTLEANMYFSNLFPPGKVWWALRNDALHPSHQRTVVSDSSSHVRLFEVHKVERVFHQIEFKGDMLR